MKKILAPFVLLSVLVLGGTARANLPECSAICSCSISCPDAANMPCHAGSNINCQEFGKCHGGFRCQHAAPVAQLKLATPVAAKPAICTPGDNPFATDDDNCLPQR
jgi:hypothetical protein